MHFLSCLPNPSNTICLVGGIPIFIDCEGIIEDVVLLGAPVEGEAKYWKALTKVVSGRIINGYCRSVHAQPPRLIMAVASLMDLSFIAFEHFDSPED